MLGGELEFLVDERTMRASAGSFFYIPGGTLHTFKNVGTEGASAPEGPPDVKKLIAAARKWRRPQRRSAT